MNENYSSSFLVGRLFSFALAKVYLLCFPLSILCFDAVALSSDYDQPIEIESDFAELDDLEGTTVYVGNVIVVQGSIRMTGDRLRVNFTEQRNLKEAFLEGKLATFRQTPDIGEDIEGEALLVEYHALENALFLIGKAKVTQGERLTQGHRINYDTEHSVVTVRSSHAAGQGEKDGQSRSQSGRVRIIIPPKRNSPPINNR